MKSKVVVFKLLFLPAILHHPQPSPPPPPAGCAVWAPSPSKGPLRSRARFHVSVFVGENPAHWQFWGLIAGKGARIGRLSGVAMSTSSPCSNPYPRPWHSRVCSQQKRAPRAAAAACRYPLPRRAKPYTLASSALPLTKGRALGSSSGVSIAPVLAVLDP